MDWRDVDRDANVAWPPRGLLTGFPHDPRADWDDQPGILRDCNKFSGRHEAASWMVPSDQGLKRTDPVLFKIEQWLISERELVAFDRKPQIGFELVALLCPLVQAFSKKA